MSDAKKMLDLSNEIISAIDNHVEFTRNGKWKYCDMVGVQVVLKLLQSKNIILKHPPQPDDSENIDDLVEEILDVCWIDKEENPATAKLIRKLLQGE